VRYLVAGAHAVMQYTEPRYTKDIDVWVEPTAENARRVWRAMVEFGAPLERMTEQDFANPGLVFQMGVAPNRIDIMMGVPGLRFSGAWKRRQRTAYGGIPIYVLSKEDIIKAKAKAGRPQDLLDLAALRTARGMASGQKRV
jgi:hypothetical protein